MYIHFNDNNKNMYVYIYLFVHYYSKLWDQLDQLEVSNVQGYFIKI